MHYPRLRARARARAASAVAMASSELFVELPTLVRHAGDVDVGACAWRLSLFLLIGGGGGGGGGASGGGAMDDDEKLGLDAEEKDRSLARGAR